MSLNYEEKSVTMTMNTTSNNQRTTISLKKDVMQSHDTHEALNIRATTIEGLGIRVVYNQRQEVSISYKKLLPGKKKPHVKIDRYLT